MNGHLNLHCDETARVRGHIIPVDGVRVMYLEIESDEGASVCLVCRDTDLLDKLSNEAERLVREFVGDVPPLEPLSRDPLDGVLP